MHCYHPLFLDGDLESEEQGDLPRVRSMVAQLGLPPKVVFFPLTSENEVRGCSHLVLVVSSVSARMVEREPGVVSMRAIEQGESI